MSNTEHKPEFEPTSILSIRIEKGPHGEAASERSALVRIETGSWLVSGTTRYFHGTANARALPFRPLRPIGLAGIYFTDDPKLAADLAVMDQVNEEDAPYIIPVQLDIRRAVALFDGESHALTPEQVAAFRAQGYDGAVGLTTDGIAFEFIAFDPAQIRYLDTGFV